MSEKNEVAAVGSKKDHLKELGKEGRKIKFNDRQKCEVLKDTQYYKKGQIINPHVTVAEKLIKEKIAKKYTEEN